jgi:glycolate oxidase FAD binding subunit
VSASGGGAIDRAIGELCRAVKAADVVVPIGGRTHWEVGGPPPSGTEVCAPSGIVEYDPAELTVTVGAGTTVRELDAVLASAGQQCPLDPRDASATIGGVLAVGLSGPRRLRYGPLRNRLLEVHFVTSDGRRVKGGGRTVKNVSGYDIARLLVGSFGTLGVIVQATLRCEPLPRATAWLDCEDSAAVARAFRVATALTDGTRTTVLVEGYDEDVAAETERMGAVPSAAPIAWAAGRHRGRVSVPPSAIDSLGRELGDLPVSWVGEIGVGTVHVATDDEAALAATRTRAQQFDGWMLREAGAPGLDGFGIDLPNRPVMARIKDALDPRGACNPGRLPLYEDSRSPVDVEPMIAPAS